jgi:hypothetical protein
MEPKYLILSNAPRILFEETKWEIINHKSKKYGPQNGQTLNDKQRSTIHYIENYNHQGITDTLLKVALTPYNGQTHSGMGDVKQYLTQIFLINDLANLSSLTVSN